MRFSSCGVLVATILAGILAPSLAQAANEEPRPNFLFIAIDDLNDFAGYAAEEPGNFLQVIYPDPQVRAAVGRRLTPNLNRLAARSAPFVRAYCPAALCGPSRTSLMTGVPPYRSGYYLHDRHFRTYDTLADAITLPQQLKLNGYYTTGLGKLFHTGEGHVDGPIRDDWADARNSWSAWTNHPIGCNGGKASRYSPPGGGLMTFGPSRLSLQQSGDWQAADFAARLLVEGQATTTGERNDAKTTVKLPADQPFFVGCGLFRPHLPFHAPQVYFDKFPVDEMAGLTREALDAIISDLEDLPPGAERFTDYRKGKLREVMDHARRVDGEAGEVAAWREMVQAYLGCVAFADECIGRLVEGYEASPQHDRTVLVLWSDHGFHLGAKYHVAKQALWEEANRVELIIHDPRNPDACNGQLRRQIVSLNDIMPTICELAGVDTPPQMSVGKSLVPLLANHEAPEIHDALLMTYMQGNHSLRTPTHRFMRYADGSRELYDMLADPAQHDNLAGQADQTSFVDELTQQLTDWVRDEVRTDGDARPARRQAAVN